MKHVNFLLLFIEIMALADKANQYIDREKPWALAKQEGQEQQVHDVCSVGINLFRQLAIYFSSCSSNTCGSNSQSFLQLESLTLHHVSKFRCTQKLLNSTAYAAC